MKKNQNFSIVNLIFLCLVVIVLSVVPTVSSVIERNNIIKNRFMGEESNFKGMIEIWHIDTFDGGSFSKFDYLEKIARNFEKKHIGVYFYIKDMTIEELDYQLNQGCTPDIFSFGMGLGNKLKDLLLEMSIIPQNISNSYLNSAKCENLQLALPYALGGYMFFSSIENLNNASIDLDQNFDLRSNINLCGYTKQYKKSVREVKSLIYGKNDFLDPILHIAGIDVRQMIVQNNNYDAYVDFVGQNKATILLGNHRDLARIENKMNLGKLSDVVYSPVADFNDLVQYVSICKNVQENKMEVVESFVKYIFDENSQNSLAEIGMFSPVKNLTYTSELYLSLQNAILNVNEVRNVFL